MNLSISNIAWVSENDNEVYEMMKSNGFTGLEIAPTRIFPENPYYKLEEAGNWSKQLMSDYGFCVPSMQSIWYGRSEAIFGSEEERKVLVDYTKKAIDFASVIGCNNLVFGCPRNRNMPVEANDGSAYYQIAVDFFKEIGDYAFSKGTVIGMEANPPIYNTNFVNYTKEAVELIEKVDSKGFRLNFDMGTVVCLEERLEFLDGKYDLINHVHISEPGLKPIEVREIHNASANKLRDASYQGFVSIEMGKCDDLSIVRSAMEYVGGVFGA